MSEYQTVEQLLEILEKRGLKIGSRPTAEHFLQTVGHYRLDSFYGAFYESPKRFDSSVPIDIDDVFNLYSFDRRLQLLLLGPIEKIEVALRSLMVKELGDYLVHTNDAKPAVINLFDKQFYDLKDKYNREKFGISADACRSSVLANWRRRRSPEERKLPKNEQNRRFSEHYRGLAAWEVLQSASFGPLANIFAVLRPEIGVKIARYFKLPRHVLQSVFYALKDLRNSCAHHNPIWNWNAQKRSRSFLFPRHYKAAAQIDGPNAELIYAYCATIHILLSVLSQGHSTWYRRLKKLINEFNTIYSDKMGFPPDWQTLSFWCVANVEDVASHNRMRALLRAK